MRQHAQQTSQSLHRTGATLFAFLFLGYLFADSSIGQTPTPSTPQLSELFDDPVEEIPSDERPQPLSLQLPDSLTKVPISSAADERTELASWARWLVLKNLPPHFEDNRKWNRQKEVFNGIHLHREGWKLETKRKKKLAKHGTWSRYYIEFIDPEKDLQIEIGKLEFPTQGPIHLETKVMAPLKLFGRVSQWSRDVQLVSVSANAKAKIEMSVVCDIHVRVNSLKLPPDVEFQPVVRDASVLLKEFEVERISQIHGPTAEWLGKGIREVLDSRLEDYRDKLVQKMNVEIGKQQGKLKLSIQDWLQTSIKKKVE
jgi:hypothetical protein